MLRYESLAALFAPPTLDRSIIGQPTLAHNIWRQFSPPLVKETPTYPNS